MTTTEQKALLLSLLRSAPMSMADIDYEIETLRTTCPETWGEFPRCVPSLLWQLEADGRSERTDDGMWRWLPAPVDKQATLFPELGLSDTRRARDFPVRPADVRLDVLGR